MYLAGAQADKGNLPQAEKLYKDVVDSAPSDYASLAKIALAQVYAAEGKNSDAEKVMHSLIDHPTTLVSKDQATIELAELLIPTNPAEAKQVASAADYSADRHQQSGDHEMGKIPQAN